MASACWAEMGALIAPPMPAFYHRPQTIDDIVTQIAARSLSFLGVDVEVSLKRWSQTPI